MKITSKDYVVELTISELKELFAFSSPKNKKCRPSSSSNKPPVNNYNKKVTLEQIKQIKSLAESGLDNHKIAEQLGLNPSLIPYWRKNTPKELA